MNYYNFSTHTYVCSNKQISICFYPRMLNKSSFTFLPVVIKILLFQFNKTISTLLHPTASLITIWHNIISNLCFRLQLECFPNPLCCPIILFYMIHLQVAKAQALIGGFLLVFRFQIVHNVGDYIVIIEV